MTNLWTKAPWGGPQEQLIGLLTSPYVTEQSCPERESNSDHTHDYQLPEVPEIGFYQGKQVA